MKVNNIPNYSQNISQPRWELAFSYWELTHYNFFIFLDIKFSTSRKIYTLDNPFTVSPFLFNSSPNEMSLHPLSRINNNNKGTVYNAFNGLHTQYNLLPYLDFDLSIELDPEDLRLCSTSKCETVFMTKQFTFWRKNNQRAEINGLNSLDPFGLSVCLGFSLLYCN